MGAMFSSTIRHASNKEASAQDHLVLFHIFLLTSPLLSVTQKLLLVRRSVAGQSPKNQAEDKV
jgi:hypothetical protein